MKRVRVSFKFKKRKISLNVLKCEGPELGLGLMFRRRESAPALLFEVSELMSKNFNAALTSFFVFFKFVAVWLDDKNNVVDIRVVKPFRFAINSKKSFVRIVEIPINKRYSREVALLVGDGKHLKR